MTPCGAGWGPGPRDGLMTGLYFHTGRSLRLLCDLSALPAGTPHALIAPGGTGLLLTDTVSSDTYPLEELWGQRPPWALMDELESTGNHLSGTTPRFIRRIVNTDPVIAGETGPALTERNGGYYTIVVERTDLACVSAPVTAEVAEIESAKPIGADCTA